MNDDQTTPVADDAATMPAPETTGMATEPTPETTPEAPAVETAE